MYRHQVLAGSYNEAREKAQAETSHLCILVRLVDEMPNGLMLFSCSMRTGA